MVKRNLEDQYGGIQKWLMICGVVLLVIWGAIKMLGLG